MRMQVRLGAGFLLLATPLSTFATPELSEMGQQFMLRNLDKGHSMDLGNFGELYLHSEVVMYLCDEDPQYSWAGDRLILCGDYGQYFPDGVLATFERKFKPPYGWATEFPAPRTGKTYSETSVLRNLCSREYIRADLFPGTNDHPGLGEALMPKIMWSHDRSLSLRTDIDIDTRGPWAGARMDIVELSVVEDDPVWKDITELAFFDFYDIWSSDMDGPDYCDCTLCTKYRVERPIFYWNRYNERKREDENPPVRRVQAVAIAEPISSDADPEERVPVVRGDFSPIETLPGEVQASIFTNLYTRDLAACAVTSKALSREATRRLYACVLLATAEQTVVLLETLKTHPEYTRYIRDLRVVTMAHWESLQVAHDILKQLPLLTSLEFAPCWFSYGDLPYWEYPFELHTLRLGLRYDRCLGKFRRSQPKAW